MVSRRPAAGPGWSAWRTIVGVFYVAAAAFSLAHTLPRASEADLVAILHRGPWVDAGVAASMGWVLAILPFLAWPYLLVNVVLAGAQGIVAARRYDGTAWEMVRRRRHEVLGR